MKLSGRYSFLFFFLTSVTIGQPEQINFRNITIDDGLSQSSVFSIVQDSTGFMWFATEDGLNRYDGYNFVVYRHKPNDSTTISDFGVRRLFVDKSGNLWIIAFDNKLNRYLPRKDSFIRYNIYNTEKHSLEMSEVIISITEDNSGRLWLGSRNGNLFWYDKKNDRFIHYKLKGNITGNVHLQCLYADRSGVLWIGTWEGLISLDLSTKKNTTYKHIKEDIRAIGGNLVFDITEDSFGRIWIATADGGISVLNKEDQTVQIFHHNPENRTSLNSDRTMSIYADSRSNIWIGTVDKGLNLLKAGNRLPPNPPQFFHYNNDPSVPWSLSNGGVMSIYEDNSGGMWFGTYGGGINHFHRQSQNFYFITHNPNDPFSISNNSILTICEDKNGSLWVGTDGGGLSVRHKNQNKFFHYFQNQHGIGSNSITAVCEDRKGNIWIGTDPGVNNLAGSLFKYDPLKNIFVTVKEVKISIGGITSIYEDSFGELWIGTNLDGLKRFNPVKGKLISYKHDKNNLKSISGNFIFSLFEDKYGVVWIGTIKTGLNRFDRETESFHCFKNDLKDPNSISNNTIWCINQDSSGNLWFGTWGGGINKFNRENETFQHFTIEDGLPSNIIYGILPDRHGNLWFSSNRGITQLNFIPQSGFSCRNFGKSEGLAALEYCAGAFYPGSNGILYFGSVNGITAFYPDSLRQNTYTPRIIITNFIVFDSSFVHNHPIHSLNEITLSHKQNFFSFEFAALDYTAPGKNRYAYRLTGVDADWVSAGNRRYASYTDISPGEYIFQVKGSNNDGIWSNSEAAITIIITPPFWRTWWFRIISLGFIAGIFYAFHRYRLNKLLEVEKTRVRIARDLHDDVSATITGMVYFSDAISKEIGDRKTPMLQKLLSLIHESAANVQESMSDIIWSINPDNDKWETVLPKFRRFASDLCETIGINYKIEIPGFIAAKPFNLERRRNLWLIFKEMVTNAVKHSYCHEITISIFVMANQFNLIVDDNGKGFDPDKLTEGNGVKNIISRSDALNGKVQLTTSPGKGTKWQLQIPL